MSAKFTCPKCGNSDGAKIRTAAKVIDREHKGGRTVPVMERWGWSCDSCGHEWGYNSADPVYY